MDWGLRIEVVEKWIEDWGLRIENFTGLRIEDWGLRFNYLFRIEDWGLRIEDWGCGKADWGLRFVLDWGLRFVWDYGLRIEDWGLYRVQDWGTKPAAGGKFWYFRGTGDRGTKGIFRGTKPAAGDFYILGVRDKGTKGTRGIYDSPPHVSRRRSVGDRFTKLKRVTTQLRNINMKLWIIWSSESSLVQKTKVAVFHIENSL